MVRIRNTQNKTNKINKSSISSFKRTLWHERHHKSSLSQSRPTRQRETLKCRLLNLITSIQYFFKLACATWRFTYSMKFEACITGRHFFGDHNPQMHPKQPRCSTELKEEALKEEELPDMLSIWASSLATTQPRIRILLCLLYGRYGMTPMILRADDVLNA